MIAFLRGINIGARKVPMADLRDRLDNAGYGPSETHIQTGNVLVKGGKRGELESLLEDWYGFEIPVIWFSAKELTAVVDDAPEPPLDAVKNHYVALLATAPRGSALDDALAELDRPDEAGIRVGRAVHLFYAGDVHKARLSNAWVEKRSGVATLRSIKVLQALVDKWCG